MKNILILALLLISSICTAQTVPLKLYKRVDNVTVIIANNQTAVIENDSILHSFYSIYKLEDSGYYTYSNDTYALLYAPGQWLEVRRANYRKRYKL